MKLLKYRQHKLSDEDLAEIFRMEREAVEPSDPGEGPYPYQHLMLPRGKPYITPEEEEGAVMMPEEFGKQFPMQADQWQAPLGNLDVMRELRRDLEDPEKAIYVLSAYTEIWEKHYQELLQFADDLKAMEDRIERATQISQMHTARDQMQKVTDKIMSTMMTAVLPLVESYRGTLWQMMSSLQPGEWTFAPGKGVIRRVDWVDEWSNRYMQRNIKRANNFEKAKQRAWNKFRRANQYTGRLLVRYGTLRTAQDEISALIDELSGLLVELDNMAQILEPLEEELRFIDIAMNLQPLERAASKIVSPDELRRLAQNDPFDPTEFITGVPSAPGADPAPTAPGAAPAKPPGVVPGTEDLEPIPIDEDEFLRLRFPEVERFPSESPWKRIQFSGYHNHLVQITYQKVTPPEDGMVKTYVVEPYSMRRRKSQRQGGATLYYFFGFDTLDMHIKSFIYRNIQNVKILPETYDPRWQVEFHWV